MSDLKPCPFCGSNASIDGDDYHGYCAHCHDCGTRPDHNFVSEAKAAEFWNRRVSPAKEGSPK